MTIADSAEHQHQDREFLSPSLHAARPSSPAYEVKFLLEEACARDLEARLGSSLRLDPHCDPANDHLYRITSLALDTRDFGVFFRDGAMRNRKYRVRRYGGSERVFLERKRSRQSRVRKRRTEAGLAELGAIGGGRSDQASQAWFLREVRALDLSPVCRVTYLRRAYYANAAEGPVRVTLDRGVEGVLCPAWEFGAGGGARPLLVGKVVCEFKFHQAMPVVLKGLVSDLRLAATGVSKYRACIRAFAGELGVDVSRGGAGASEGGGRCLSG